MITQNAIKNTLIKYFYINGSHFSKWPPEYTCFNIPATNQHRKRSLCLNIHFQDQDKGLGRII